MKTCNKCIINDNYPGISFNETGTCSLCVEQRIYKPIGEDKLLDIFREARKKNADYDVMVPLSGGKDSTYILHLAVNVYKLKVLAMTYDNGLFNQIALDNIQSAIEITKVKHIFCKPDKEIQRKIYRSMFLLSGDICGACDIGTKANILKVATDYSIPLILLGTSPLENDSFLPDSIQDKARFKYILRKSNDLSTKEINDFLIYPNLNLFLFSFYKKIGKIAKEVSPLSYIDNPTDKEMGDIITKEMNWKEDNSREYSKHFDCVAEPLTNYVRNKIYGYERRLCQYSNMIRRNEITREKALELYSIDDIASKPDNYQDVLRYLKITEEDLQMITNIQPLKYEKNTSRIDRFFTRLMKIKKLINNR